MLLRPSSGNLLKCLRQFKIPAAYSSSNIPDAAVIKAYQKEMANFPRPVRLETNPPTVFGFIPKSWFDFLYPKTGVTGPYMLLTGVGTYLLSKEIFVLSKEVATIYCYVLLSVAIHKMYGNKIKGYLMKLQDEEIAMLDSAQESAKKSVAAQIEYNDLIKYQGEGILQYLPEAKKENVYLQMEASYRDRLQQAYLKVKKHLDYQVEKQNIENRIAQKNMVDWILKNVEQSITPQLKKNALKQCIGDLKALAVKP